MFETKHLRAVTAGGFAAIAAILVVGGFFVQPMMNRLTPTQQFTVVALFCAVVILPIFMYGLYLSNYSARKRAKALQAENDQLEALLPSNAD